MPRPRKLQPDYRRHESSGRTFVRFAGKQNRTLLESRVAVQLQAGEATDEVGCAKVVLRLVRKLYGDLPVAEFDSPKMLAVQQAMIGEGWARTYRRRLARCERGRSRNGPAAAPLSCPPQFATLFRSKPPNTVSIRASIYASER
jgi:hypothetical protein